MKKMAILSAAVALSLAASSTSAGAGPCSLPEDSQLFEGLSNRVWSARIAGVRVRDAALRQLQARCPSGEFDPESRTRFYEYLRREIEYQKWARTYTGARGEPVGEAYSYYIWDLQQYLHRVVDPAKDLAYSHLILEFGLSETIAKLGRAVEPQVRSMLGATDESRLKAAHAIGLWIDPENTEFSQSEKEQLVSVLIPRLPEQQEFRDDYWGSLHSAETIIRALSRSSSVAARDAIRTWLEKFESRPITGRRAPTEHLTVKAAREAIASIEKRLAAKTDP